MRRSGDKLTDGPADRGRVPAPDGEDEARLWSVFVDAGSSAEFLAAWLSLQCRFIPHSRTGLLLVDQDGTFRPAAIWPSSLADVTYLGEVAERTIRDRRGVVHASARQGQEGGSVLVGYPIEVDETLHGVVVVDVASRPGEDIRAALRQLHWGAGWLEILFRQHRTGELNAKVERAALAMDVLAVTEDQGPLQASAMALVNELAKRLACDRVSLGLRRGRRVRLRAMSHSAWFQRKSDLVAAIEAAMREALDQNATVSLPAVPGTDRRVAVAHQRLADRDEVPANASVILRNAGKAVGVLTLERSRAFDADTVALAELVASTAGPLIGLKAQEARPVAGWLAAAGLKALRAVFGPRHPGLKLALVSAALLIAFLSFTDGAFRITAKAVLEGAVQRAAVAPFNGYIAQAPIRAGDKVAAGQLLAQLDDADLRLERLKAESELQKLDQRRRDAQAKHDRATLGVIAAQVSQAEAELALANEKLSRTRITAPIDGIVVTGDLSQMLGSPIEQGKVLFEIAPLDQYRLVLQVDEADIRYVEPNQTGTFALTGQAEQPVGFVVDKLTSVSTPQEGRNFFRVEAHLENPAVPLRPGMEGVGKVDVGERPLLWVLTRTMVARLRLLAWNWLPW